MELSILVLSLLALVLFALCCLLFFKNTGLSGAVLGARAELDAIKTQGKTLADRAEKLEDEKANLSAQNRSLERELATLRERERALNEKFGEFSAFSAIECDLPPLRRSERDSKARFLPLALKRLASLD